MRTLSRTMGNLDQIRVWRIRNGDVRCMMSMQTSVKGRDECLHCSLFVFNKRRTSIYSYELEKIENNSGFNTPQHQHRNLVLLFGRRYTKENFVYLFRLSFLSILRHIARTRHVQFRISQCLCSDSTLLGLPAFQVCWFWLVQSNCG